MSDLDLDCPDVTAFALGEAEGERLDRALEVLMRSEEARAMAAETLKLGERLTEAFGGEPAGHLSGTERARLARAARRQLWARRLKRVGLTAAICGLTAAATLAGVAVLPPDGRAAEPRDQRGRTVGAAEAAEKADETSTPVESGGLELGLPVAATGDAGGVYRLSLSADAVQAAAEKNWKFSFGPSGEATFGPAVAQSAPEAASQPGGSARSGIDDFVAERLENDSIKASSETDDATVLRRLSLDIRGTVPTPEEIDAFETDPSPDKFGKKVNELLGASDRGFEFFDRATGAGGQAAEHGIETRESVDGFGPSSAHVRGSFGVSGRMNGEIGPPRRGHLFGVSGRMSGVTGSPLPVSEPRPAPGIDASAFDPAELRALMEELREQEERIRTEVESRVRGERLAALDRLRVMLDESTRAGRLDDAIAVRAVLWRLEEDLFDVRPNPGRLTGFRATSTGTSYVFRVTGNPNAGAVWGSGVYTDDSALAAAAVHAGVLRAGQTGLVRVTILPGQSSYSGLSQNGVSSHPYHSWQMSYRVERFDPNPAPAPPSTGKSSEVIEHHVSPYNYRNLVGGTLLVRVTGDPSRGMVWGTGVYTDDSPLAAAAVHAGVLKAGETGVVKVTLLPGQKSYAGSARNGVTSRSYHEWDGSYRLERSEVDGGTTIGPSDAVPDPGDLSALANEVGKTLLVRVTGSVVGSVWGTDVYTSDSTLAAAAVHAGAVRPGQVRIVRVTILPGQESYSGSMRNGVPSRDWRNWGASYRVEPVPGTEGGDPAHENGSVGGKYRGLLMTIDVPEDRQTYGEFRDYGFWGDPAPGRSEGYSYRGHENLPAAYWVYVAPTWYLWAESSDSSLPGGPPGLPGIGSEATPGGVPFQNAGRAAEPGAAPPLTDSPSTAVDPTGTPVEGAGTTSAGAPPSVPVDPAEAPRVNK